MLDGSIPLLSSIQATMHARSTAEDLDAATQALLKANAHTIGQIIEELRRYRALMRTLNLALIYDGEPILEPVPGVGSNANHQLRDSDLGPGEPGRGDGGGSDLASPPG